jgi:Flp pilus assembly CpaE family ATPase
VRAPAEVGSLLALIAAGRKGEELALERPEPLQRRARPAGEGSLIAFLGSKGAPGSSELAASFAALVSRRHRVLLAELDGGGGALALRLGVDPHAGSLLGLARALAAGNEDPRALLPHWIVAGARGWPAVLTGLPDPRRDLAETATPGLVGALLELLRGSFPLVACDLGHRLSDCGERDLAARLHREVALAADALVLVLGARGSQLQAGLAQLDLLLGELGAAPEALRVVVNGQPGMGRQPRAGTGSISAELASRGLAVDAWLPFDGRALRASARRGLPFALASRRGAYTRSLAGLVSSILLPSLPRPGARKRLLPALPAGSAEGTLRASEEVALPWRA